MLSSRTSIQAQSVVGVIRAKPDSEIFLTGMARIQLSTGGIPHCSGACNMESLSGPEKKSKPGALQALLRAAACDSKFARGNADSEF